MGVEDGLDGECDGGAGDVAGGAQNFRGIADGESIATVQIEPSEIELVVDGGQPVGEGGGEGGVDRTGGDERVVVGWVHVGVVHEGVDAVEVVVECPCGINWHDCGHGQ